MAQFQTNPWKLSDLLAQMDASKIVLPEFQRSFVWRPYDIDLLLTSLVLDYPAGSLLFLSSDPSNELAWRPVEGIDQSMSRQPDYLVLDGQQRLTSLSVSLNGRGDHLFYIDLDLLAADDIENAVYPIRRAKAERQKLLDRVVQFEKRQYPLSAAMGVGQYRYWFQDYVDHHVENGRDRDEVRELVRTLEDTYVEPLRDYRFPVVELPVDTSLDAVCQIFETLNKTGMRLTVFDLLTARFWPKEIDLRQMYAVAQEDHPLLSEEEFNVEPTYLLQAIALLRTGRCQRGDLLLLDADGFVDEWDRVCAAASTALSVLRGDCGVLTRDWLPYATLLPALFALSTRIRELHGPAVGKAWEKVRRWFWASSFGQRYDGPINTVNAADYAQVSAWFEDDDAIPDAISSFRIDDVSLAGVVRRSNAAYRAVISLTVVNGAHDFHTGNRLTEDFLHDPSRSIEDHHLHPSGYLSKLKPPRKPVNSILNRCLIDHSTNRIITNKAPSVYLAEIEAKLGGEGLEAVLSSHLIPHDGPGALGNDDVDAFLAARERLILGAIASVTGAELSLDEPAEAYLDPRRPFTNELALRKVIRSLTGDVLWYEQHMGRKALELLSEEIDKDSVSRVRLLSGSTHVDDRARSAFRRFAEEFTNLSIEVEWHVVPDELGRAMHARVIFSDAGAWELPPLNLLLMGTVDSIHPSEIEREAFDDAWDAARPI